MSRTIWLIRDGEVLPCDGDSVRLFRMGLLAEIIADDPENEVVWWCGTLNHFKKEQRMDHDGCLKISERYTLEFIHSPEYHKNMSIQRLFHQFYQGWRFRQLAEQKKEPDLILCSIPTPELAYFAVRYGKKHHIPVFIDIRDLFPDTYVDFCSPKIRPLVKMGIIPFQKMVRSALRNATGIIGTSERFLAWGLRNAGRKRTDRDRVYYVSYPDNNIEITEEDLDFWKGYGLKKEDFICCFFGQFGFSVDLELVMRAACIVAPKNPNIKFVICGVGEKLKVYQELVKDVDNVIFPGWVDRKHICSLGRLSSAGLLAYKESANFENSMPNKFCEYLALGQVLLLQPKGLMLKFIEKYQCGIQYNDEWELANVILDLSKDKARVEMMKKNALKLFERKFCAEKVYGEYARFLEEQALERKE